MKYLRWILTIPLAVVIVVFSVGNRQAVLVDPWPVGEPLPVPLYFLVFGAAATGFLAGSILQWLSHTPSRLLARRRGGRISKLEAELGKLKQPPIATDRRGLPATVPPLDAV